MEYDFYWNHCVFLSFYEGHKSVKHTDMYSKYYNHKSSEILDLNFLYSILCMPLIHHLYLLTIGKKRDTLTILELHYDPWVDFKIFLRVCQGYRCKIFMEI